MAQDLERAIDAKLLELPQPEVDIVPGRGGFKGHGAAALSVSSTPLSALSTPLASAGARGRKKGKSFGTGLKCFAPGAHSWNRFAFHSESSCDACR
jgi:hypothetical protein